MHTVQACQAKPTCSPTADRCPPGPMLIGQRHWQPVASRMYLDIWPTRANPWAAVTVVRWGLRSSVVRFCFAKQTNRAKAGASGQNGTGTGTRTGAGTGTPTRAAVSLRAPAGPGWRAGAQLVRRCLPFADGCVASDARSTLRIPGQSGASRHPGRRVPSAVGSGARAVLLGPWSFLFVLF